MTKSPLKVPTDLVAPPPFLLFPPRMWWKWPCHGVCVYRATPRACHDGQPKKWFQNALWETNFIWTKTQSPQKWQTWYWDTQTLPVIGADVEQAPGCPPEFFNLTLSMSISMSDPFVSLPGYKLQLLAGLWNSRGLRKGLVGPREKN